MNNMACPDCKRKNQFVLDYAAGDVICTECGLVLESHFVDDTPEWRTYANEGDSKDRNRVGEALNALLPDGGIATTISHVQGNSEFSSLKRAESRVSHGDSNRFLASTSRCATMASRLGLVSTIQSRANEIYQKVAKLHITRGKNQDAVLASCLYLACRQEGKTRSIKEICSVAEGASRKEVGRAVLSIERHMEEQNAIHAEDFLRRFCSSLGMNHTAVRAATEVVRVTDNQLDIRKNPTSIATAAIFMVSQLHEAGKNSKSLDEISRVSGVHRSTIWETYGALHPHASMIIPSWFAKEDQLRALVDPPSKRKGGKSAQRPASKSVPFF